MNFLKRLSKKGDQAAKRASQEAAATATSQDAGGDVGGGSDDPSLKRTWFYFNDATGASNEEPTSLVELKKMYDKGTINDDTWIFSEEDSKEAQLSDVKVVYNFIKSNITGHITKANLSYTTGQCKFTSFFLFLFLFLFCFVFYSMGC